jgi:hypothetical protein
MKITLEQIREQFPGLNDRVFLDAACVSLAPKAAADAIAQFLAEAVHCRARSSTLHHIRMDAARNEVRPEAARLIGAPAEDIAVVESTTQGLSIAARALLLGDRVLHAGRRRKRRQAHGESAGPKDPGLGALHIRSRRGARLLSFLQLEGRSRPASQCRRRPAVKGDIPLFHMGPAAG